MCHFGVVFAVIWLANEIIALRNELGAGANFRRPTTMGVVFGRSGFRNTRSVERFTYLVAVR